MSKVKSQTNDPANYHKMSEPFDNSEAANEALTNFYTKDATTINNQIK